MNKFVTLLAILFITACTQTAPVTVELDGSYTLEEVATQNTAASCWSAINGSIYDFTQSIEDHPGGKSAILRMCGTDATDDLLDQHGESERIMAGLEDNKIGELE